MYKILNLELKQKEGSDYLLTGEIEHPENVMIKLESIEDDEEQKQVMVNYLADETKEHSSVMFTIDQPLVRPAWADKAVVVVRKPNRRRVVEDSVIFD